VYSLSAIDLFASAMGAFLIITIILMPDYQKEVRLEGHLAYIESLATDSTTLMEETDQVASDIETNLAAERGWALELQAERDILDAELQSILAQLRQARRTPPPEAEPVVEEPVNNRVTFRFLGLKTDATRILFLVDMNKYLAEHESLVQRTVIRALDSLGEGYEFAILGFKQLDTGVQYYRWPAEGNLAVMSSANRSRARRFIAGLSGKFSGSSPLYAAFETAFRVPADAIVLLSDGLPNPTFNQNLPPASLAQEITLINNRGAEIHSVTIGDYFKYRGTVEFMERLAAANEGDFLALAQ
jgi:hypothetical protein